MASASSSAASAAFGLGRRKKNPGLLDQIGKFFGGDKKKKGKGSFRGALSPAPQKASATSPRKRGGENAVVHFFRTIGPQKSTKKAGDGKGSLTRIFKMGFSTTKNDPRQPRKQEFFSSQTLKSASTAPSNRSSFPNKWWLNQSTPGTVEGSGRHKQNRPAAVAFGRLNGKTWVALLWRRRVFLSRLFVCVAFAILFQVEPGGHIRLKELFVSKNTADRLHLVLGNCSQSSTDLQDDVAGWVHSGYTQSGVQKSLS
ncbi:Myelin basic protein [Oryzias melastigma]|uniref:Myelin basic protein n=1 Tax=Oryzias melastigma TaxID=30732 RepID=A0A834FSU4_ORYME|nr:Myelin basic protein [Oryzias melastigma]